MKGTVQMGKNGSGSEAKGNGLAHGNYSRLDLPAPHCIPTFYVPICKVGTIALLSLKERTLPFSTLLGPEAVFWNLRAGNQSSSLLRGLQYDQG